MKERTNNAIQYIKEVNPAQLLISIAGGLILFLVPNDTNMVLPDPFNIFAVAFISLITCIAIFFIFKDYRLVGISLLTCTIFVMIDFIINNAETLVQTINDKRPFLMTGDKYNDLCAVATWAVPFVVCIIIRIFAIAKFDTPEKRNYFSLFIYFSFICFLIYFIIISFRYFIFINPVDIFGTRSFSIIPFNNISPYQSEQSAFFHYISAFCLFIPMGFYTSIYNKKAGIIKSIAIYAICAAGIELIKLIFNTGLINLDLIIIAIIGGIVGMLLKILINKSRAFIILNEETDIFRDCSLKS